MNEKLKHTAGPWEASGNLVRSAMHQPEGLPRGVQICECRDGYFLPHTEEAKSNACLIAVSPELLELLVESQTSIGGDWRERRDALIAKATGKTSEAA